ncbi:hypothetical protein ACTWQF_09750 [Streptomyces sp. 8N114]|uniref:hypothetical protein n=1 Tax=Streptomyces sp. 8N114 TaxID=3457419 RepID=UPI003FD48204
MKSVRRALSGAAAATVLTVAAAVLPLATATSAHADYNACKQPPKVSKARKPTRPV